MQAFRSKGTAVPATLTAALGQKQPVSNDRFWPEAGARKKPLAVAPLRRRFASPAERVTSVRLRQLESRTRASPKAFIPGVHDAVRV